MRVPSVGLILAGGEGTRLRPLTYKTPKPLIELAGRPLIEYPIMELARQGVRRIVVSVGYRADDIIGYLGGAGERLGVEIECLRESRALGTGGAIKFALGRLGRNDFVTANSDTIFKLDLPGMYRVHVRTGAAVTIAAVHVEDVTGSGVVEVDGDSVTSFVEKPDPSRYSGGLINAGIYIVSGGVRDMMPSAETFSFERDFLQEAAADGLVSAYQIDTFYTVNDMEQYTRVSAMLGGTAAPGYGTDHSDGHTSHKSEPRENP